MARLTIASTEYPVRSSGVRYDDLTKRRLAFSGAVVTSRPTSSGAARAWGFETDILTRTEADTLVTALTGTAAVTAGGEAVGGSSVSCRAVGVSFQEIFEDMVLVSFELWEVSP